MTDAAFTCDEPPGSASPRGWLICHATPAGFCLDYGPDNHRPGHQTEICPGTVVSFCKPDNMCRECQPGNILAVRYPDGPGTKPRTSRHVETIGQARQFVETRKAAGRAAGHREAGTV